MYKILDTDKMSN